MPFLRTDQLPGEPIQITRFEGHVTPSDVKKATANNADYLAKNEGQLYSIADLRAITTAFPDILMILHNDSKGNPGSSTDPRLVLMLVGTNDFVTFFADAMKKLGGVQIPVFTDLDEAINAARMMVSKERR